MSRLFDEFKKHILTPNDVIQKAIDAKLAAPNNTSEYIKSHFSQLVEELQGDAYSIYLESEQHSGQMIIRNELLESTFSNASREDVIEASAEMFNELDRFYLSLTQSRKSRAGAAFETILKTLFKNLKYPFDEQQVINGKPDFLMPSRAYYDTNPMDCIIFTAKRSLRERWRQIVTEGTRGLGFFLATIDEDISENQLKEMMDHRIYLVIPHAIKERIDNYSSAPNVITYEEFFRQQLDPALQRWADKGVL